MSEKPKYPLPGRLGEPTLQILDDSRLDPRLKQAMIKSGYLASQGVEIASFTVDTVRPIVKAANDIAQMVYDNADLSLPQDATEPELVETTETVPSFDGAEVKITFFRRADAKNKTVPAVVYIHGGAMVILNAYNPVHVRWCRSLAVAGVTAVLVDYRNAYLESSHNKFPTGLNDCAAALDYLYEHRERLGISKIVLHGESGGANLAMATALKAKREGKVDRIAGVHAYVPYISNAYHWSEERKLKELPSLVECDAYMLDHGSCSAFGWYYGPDDMENPHAWPYHAGTDDLKGLPPHVLVMEELDPLRDEGMAYHRKLLAAGVSSRASVGLGMFHASRIMFRRVVPEHYDALVDDIVTFAMKV